jgi:hypothetical protein
MRSDGGPHVVGAPVCVPLDHGLTHTLNGVQVNPRRHGQPRRQRTPAVMEAEG